MKPIIHGVGISSHPGSIRRWQPDDPSVVVETVIVEIGSKAGKRQGTDQFYICIATPAGLDTLEAEDGILMDRRVVVMKRYDFDDFWRWLDRTISSCEARTWPECLDKLRTHFHWEYDGYKES